MTAVTSRPRVCFVAGTDTGVGKTRVSLALLQTLSGLGYRTAALKPVAQAAKACCL